LAGLDRRAVGRESRWQMRARCPCYRRHIVLQAKMCNALRLPSAAVPTVLNGLRTKPGVTDKPTISPPGNKRSSGRGGGDGQARAHTRATWAPRTSLASLLSGSRLSAHFHRIHAWWLALARAGSRREVAAGGAPCFPSPPLPPSEMDQIVRGRRCAGLADRSVPATSAALRQRCQ
jgi:hypothetical protein